MTVILSCGHREDDFDRHYNVMTKEWTRENTKAVAYKCVCFHCLMEYEKDKTILNTDDEALQWLRN
jgi:hypothetical protein